MDEDIERKVSQLTAEYMLRRLEHGAKFADEQVAAQSKWLTASLLAVNSAGLIAAAQSASNTRSTWALAAFAIGIGCSLLSGAVIQEGYLKPVPRALSKRIPYWTRVSISGVRDPEEEALHEAERGKLTWYDVVPPTLGYLAGFLWFAGAILLALAKPEPTPEPRIEKGNSAPIDQAGRPPTGQPTQG